MLRSNFLNIANDNFFGSPVTMTLARNFFFDAAASLNSVRLVLEAPTFAPNSLMSYYMEHLFPIPPIRGITQIDYILQYLFRRLQVFTLDYAELLEDFIS